MLIGANCMKALELVKKIARQDGGLYAYKTKLGWCIVGPIVSTKNKEALSCNRIAVKDAITGKLLSHHFVKDPGYKTRANEVQLWPNPNTMPPTMVGWQRKF